METTKRFKQMSGVQLKQARSKAGMSLREVGDVIGVTKQSINQYELYQTRLGVSKVNTLKEFFEQLGIKFIGLSEVEADQHKLFESMREYRIHEGRPGMGF